MIGILTCVQGCNGHTDIMNILLENGVMESINEKDEDGWTVFINDNKVIMDIQRSSIKQCSRKYL